MGKVGSKAKYVKYLIIAAVLLPLIFIAEVIYVEQHQAQNVNQVQKEELEKLRAEAAAAWLANQAAHLRGIAKLNSVTNNNTAAAAAEFRSFLEPGTGLMVLGYADLDGNILVDTGTSDAGPIKKQPYFTEAVAGREYIGQANGDIWQQKEDVVIMSIPAYSQGEAIGVVYGVISKATMDSVTAKLIPATIVSKPPTARLLGWLSGVYLTGLIPLLLLVYLMRRQTNLDTVMPQASRNDVRGRTQADLAEHKEPIKPKRVEPPADVEDPIERLTKELARVSKKFEELENQERLAVSKQPVVMNDVSPSVVIDRVLAAAAYKNVEKTTAVATTTEAKEEPKAERRPLFNYIPDTPAEPREPVVSTIPVLSAEPREPAVSTVPVSLAALEEPAVSIVSVSPTELGVETKRPEPDALTGLPSREKFEKIIAAHDGQPDTAILIFSLDGIKVINDFLGKKTGDAVILAAFDILRTVAGDECIATRIGDRFVALLTGIGADFQEDVKKDVKYYLDLHNLRHPELPLSITTGIASAGQGDTLQAVWQQAETDLDKFKAMNRVEARRFIMWSIKRNRGRA